MNCQQFRDALFQWIDEELEGDTARAAAEHESACADCAANAASERAFPIETRALGGHGRAARTRKTLPRRAGVLVGFAEAAREERHDDTEQDLGVLSLREDLELRSCGCAESHEVEDALAVDLAAT